MREIDVAERGVRSRHSQCPFQLRMLDPQGEVIATGTAFIYDASNGEHLVTSWHNVSGRDPFSGTPLSPAGVFPLSAQANFATWITQDEPRQFSTVATPIALYGEDHEPLWLEHPTLGSRCDVVALPFNRSPAIPSGMHHPANKIEKLRVPVLPGGQVFIIGFPRSLSVGFGLPIWKSGSIASEPHYDVRWGGALSPIGGMIGGTEIPAFFVDALTRAGLSGAPVFARHTGMWDLTDPYRDVDPTLPSFHSRDDVILHGDRMQFVGLYGGRAPAAEGEAGLGFVWKDQVLEDICSSGRPGRHPHIVQTLPG